jgi:hypothetical protein
MLLGMGLIVIAMLVVWAAVGVMFVQNPGIVHVSMLSYGWDVPMWLPAAIGVAAMSALLLLYMVASGIGHQVRWFSFRRTVEAHERTVADMEDEIARLKDQLAAARGRPATAAPAAAPTRDWRDWLRRPGGTSRAS